MCDLNCSTCEIKAYLIKEKGFSKESLEGKNTSDLFYLIEDAGMAGAFASQI